MMTPSTMRATRADSGLILSNELNIYRFSLSRVFDPCIESAGLWQNLIEEAAQRRLECALSQFEILFRKRCGFVEFTGARFRTVAIEKELGDARGLQARSRVEALGDEKAGNDAGACVGPD